MQEFNQEAYDDFWNFINRRHKIFLKKWRGDPKPWTDDVILREWKFCNIFRQYDRQSKWLIDNVIKPHWNDDLGLLLFNLYAFRAFNYNPTYRMLLVGLLERGIQKKPEHLIDNWDPQIAKEVLEQNSRSLGRLTSGAYMIRGREGMPKYESIVQTLTSIWEQAPYVAEHLQKWSMGMKQIQDLLMSQKFWGWGSFTTYQIVLDLTYTKWLENASDINTWCEFGPGAVRGIREIYPELPNKMMLEAARGLLLDSPKFLEPHVPKLSLQDIEFCCCELSSYERVKHGGRKKERYPGNG